MNLTRQSLAAIAVVLMFVAAAFAATIRTDYDHAADFTKYRTYKWLNQPRTRNPLMRDRIIADINVEMNLKGLELDQTGGTLGIAAHAATREERTLDTFYSGMGGWRWGGIGTATTQVITYEVGTLVVDLFDTATKQVIWRGTATGTVSDNPEKNTKQVQKAVQQMFKQCPLRPKPATE